MDKTDAILIRKFRFSETSILCIWLTEGFGKVKTSARGALKPGGAFHGKIDLFYQAEIGFVRSRSGEIHALREVSLREPFTGNGASYANLAVASYFAELCDAITEPMAVNDGLYDLLHRAVRYLGGNAPTYRAILHFESEMCRLLGILHENTDPAHSLAQHAGRVPAGRQTAIKAVRERPDRVVCNVASPTIDQSQK